MPAPVVAAAAPAALPWLGGALAGAGALLGSVTSGLFGSGQAKRQMDFQERMSNTAHQREMEDLRRAGLNPLLSSRHGGAVTPAGSSAQAPDFASSVNSAVAAMRLKMDSALQAAQINDINSSAALKEAQKDEVYGTLLDRVELLIAQKQKTLQDEKVGFQEAKKIRTEIDVLRAQRDSIRANTANVLADSEKKKFQAKPYELGNKAIQGVEGFIKKLPEHKKNIRKFIDKQTGRRPGATGSY